MCQIGNLVSLSVLVIANILVDDVKELVAPEWRCSAATCCNQLEAIVRREVEVY